MATINDNIFNHDGNLSNHNSGNDKLTSSSAYLRYSTCSEKIYTFLFEFYHVASIKRFSWSLNVACLAGALMTDNEL